MTSDTAAARKPAPTLPAIRDVLRPIAARYPAMQGRNLLDDPANDLYVQRTAFDIDAVISRIGRRATVVDIGGGLGLFSLGLAQLGARSILVDDFAWLRQQTFGSSVFGLFEEYGVETIERDVIADGLDLPERVDAVTNFHFMEHVHNSPKKLFHEVAQSLAPNGLFVLGGPNAVNLRKRITVPFGKGKWSSMETWYESPVFRGHVREPDVADLRYITRDMGLTDEAVLGANFLGQSSAGAKAVLARRLDPILRLRPTLCSDIYIVARKPA